VPGFRRSADLVFFGARVAVFIDGCFWHGCPDHGHSPRRNVDYWTPKLARNMARDAETDEVLRTAGWLPMRFWEHDDPEDVSRAIAVEVRGRRIATQHASRPGQPRSSPG
jgi:DNA mismatch endonuclease (patch repair protein)